MLIKEKSFGKVFSSGVDIMSKDPISFEVGKLAVKEGDEVKLQQEYGVRLGYAVKTLTVESVYKVEAYDNFTLQLAKQSESVISMVTRKSNDED